MISSLRYLLLLTTILFTGCSLPPQDAQVFGSAPGPFLTLHDGRSLAVLFIRVQSSKEALPDQGVEEEVFEIEFNMTRDQKNALPFPQQINVYMVRANDPNPGWSQVESFLLDDVGTIVLEDSSPSQCTEDYCFKDFYVRFELRGSGFVSTDWFIKNAIYWQDSEAKVPEGATVTITHQWYE